jgi:hypothetical protein
VKVAAWPEWTDAFSGVNGDLTSCDLVSRLQFDNDHRPCADHKKEPL